MKKLIPPTLFLMMTAGLIYTGTQSVATNASFGTLKAPDTLAGIDISVSAVACSTSGSKSFTVYKGGTTSTTCAAMPTGRFVISANTVSCNTRPNNTGATIGGVFYQYPVPEWYERWDASDLPANDPRGARHPYIATNVYRTNAAGRLEMLGSAWVKHGFFAASAQQNAIAGANGQPACGTTTCSGPNNNGLGANCSDTYGASLNVAADDMGPRTEINPHAPAGLAFDPGTVGYTMTGSWANMRNRDAANTYRDNVVNTTNALTKSYTYTGATQAWKLASVKLADILPSALGTTGRVFIEAYYVVNGDKYKFNNVAYRRFATTGVTDATTVAALTSANFNFDGPHNFGAAILDWGDKQAAFTPADEGVVYAASRVVPLGGGQYRYEYNVYNLDLDREVNAFKVPMPSFAALTSPGFNQPRVSEPGYHSHVDPANPPANADTPDNNTDWVMSRVNDTVVYTPPTAPAGFIPNTLRWGKMNTFWFTSNMPPRLGKVSVAQRRSGTNGELKASTIEVPKHPCDIALDDASPAPTFTIGNFTFRDGSGAVNEGDYNCFFQFYFDEGPNALVGDIANDQGLAGPDGHVNEGDYNFFFANFFAE